MKILSNNPKETIEIGRSIGAVLKRGDIVALVGQLGSGKTTIAKGIVKGIGAKKGTNINSPSFVLVREYIGKIPVFHIDLYRIDKEINLESFGFRDYLGDSGITIIEWADKFPQYLPRGHILIRLSQQDCNERLIEIEGLGQRAKRL